MLFLRVVFVVFLLFFPCLSLSAGLPALPGSISAHRELPLAAEVRRWTPDTMFEHVNGEAELLKRYGAESLAFAVYENSDGEYLSAELLDMGRPINAYGLYRLYGGCESGEYRVAGATVLGDEYTSYAILDRYFFRISTESDDAANSRVLVDSFLAAFSEKAASAATQQSMPVLEYLKGVARRPCEVQYHPEHLDYDLDAGPGYTWVGPDGQSYFLNLLPNDSAARQHGAMLGGKGVESVVVSGSTVVWRKGAALPLGEYGEAIAKEIDSRSP